MGEEKKKRKRKLSPWDEMKKAGSQRFSFAMCGESQ